MIKFYYNQRLKSLMAHHNGVSVTLQDYDLKMRIMKLDKTWEGELRVVEYSEELWSEILNEGEIVRGTIDVHYSLSLRATTLQYGDIVVILYDIDNTKRQEALLLRVSDMEETGASRRSVCFSEELWTELLEVGEILEWAEIPEDFTNKGRFC